MAAKNEESSMRPTFPTSPDLHGAYGMVSPLPTAYPAFSSPP